METAIMGNWEPAAQTERVRDGNPPPKVARAVLLLDNLQVRFREGH